MHPQNLLYKLELDNKKKLVYKVKFECSIFARGLIIIFLEGGIFFLMSDELTTYYISLSDDTQVFLEWYILYDNNGHARNCLSWNISLIGGRCVCNLSRLRSCLK